MYKLEQYAYKLHDEVMDQDQLYVFNVIRTNTKVVLTDVYLLVRQKDMETKCVLNITKLLKQIFDKPELSLVGETQKGIIDELFREVLIEHNKNDGVLATEISESEVDEIEELLKACNKANNTKLTEYDDIVNELKNGNVPKRTG